MFRNNYSTQIIIFNFIFYNGATYQRFHMFVYIAVITVHSTI